MGADLEQLQADGAACGVGEAGRGQGDAAQRADQDMAIEDSQSRNWLARMVRVEVLSANRSS